MWLMLKHMWQMDHFLQFFLRARARFLITTPVSTKHPFHFKCSDSFLRLVAKCSECYNANEIDRCCYMYSLCYVNRVEAESCFVVDRFS